MRLIFGQMNKTIKHGATAYNRSVYASPPVGDSGYEKPQSGYALCAVLSPPQFGQGSMLRIALLPAQTVANSRNVKRNCTGKYFLSIWKVKYFEVKK